MSAKELFEILGYHPIDHYQKWSTFVCGYESNELMLHYPQFVVFCDEGTEGVVFFEHGEYATADLTKAVYEQMKELRWVDG